MSLGGTPGLYVQGSGATWVGRENLAGKRPRGGLDGLESIWTRRRRDKARVWPERITVTDVEVPLAPGVAVQDEGKT